MSANSNDKGRAYEYAWIRALYNALHKTRNTKVVKNSSIDANKRAYMAMSDEMRRLFEISANAAVDTILELEPLMCEDGGDELLLEFQYDGAGIKGDVRDIVIKRKDIHWQVGLSIKHNHEAIKHSRLSPTIDFGREWFGIPCSKEYWNAVNPIFNRLKIDKSKGVNWYEIDDKVSTVYVPLLQAFMDEVRRAYGTDANMPKKMTQYLIGKNDYYKVVSQDKNRLTIIHTFNIHGTLNKPGKMRVSAITVPIVELPTELVALKFKTGSSNTVEMYLNNGWQLSFRIHNASTKVEPSLKFDVQFISMPLAVLNIECRWN